MPRESNDLGMAPETVEVRMVITSTILVQMGQVLNLLASTQE